MKHFVILFVSLPSICFAQGNLQINQIINLTNGANYIVPTGKVIKVESVNGPNAKINGILSSYFFDGFYSSGTYAKYKCRYSNIDINNSICIGSASISLSSSWFGGSIDINTHPPYDTVGSCPIIGQTHYEYPSGSSSSPSFQTPIWLHSGQQINIFPGNGLLISAIEFNITP